jgi:uncharacterized membrane protein YfcA
MELLALGLIGAASGLIAGLVGLAGGFVVVPALTWLYGPQALHSAIIVSWFSVMFNSMGAAANQWHMRDAHERTELLNNARWYLMGAVMVTPLIALGANHYRGVVSSQLVGMLQLCLAAVMLWPVAEGSAGQRQSALRDASFGGIISAVSTVIGVGGGTYTIAYFVYGAGARLRDAIAAANLTGLAIGILSVAGYLGSVALFGIHADEAGGPVSTWGMAVMVAAGLITAPLGGRLSKRLKTKQLRQILIGALVLSAGRLLLA